MSSQTRRAPRKPAPRKAGAARNRRARSNRTAWIAIVIVVVMGAAAIFATMSSSKSSKKATTAQPAPQSVIKPLTSVPESVITAVGEGNSIAPTKIDGQTLTTADGKPRILYVGAEYCPYCATERWALVNALSRFGTFSNLGQTHSSSTDTYPNTPTLSFHGSTYTSPYVDFQGVETAGNELAGSNYPPLDKLTNEQSALFSKYDAPPYVAAGSTGGIPFIDFANRYLVHGVTYHPEVLQGKTASEIVAELQNPDSQTTQGMIGAANSITAAICKVTNNQPATACSNPAVTAAAAKLG